MTGVAVAAQEPPGWREIPEEYQGKLTPNYYCRGWNRKRGKYCGRRAGAGTDHPDSGRCKNHGGATPIKSGVYSLVQRPRIAELIQHFERQGNTDMLPELFAARALFIEWIERYDERTEALLAWHASFSGFQRPIAADKEEAFRRIVEEYEILLKERDTDPRSERFADVDLAQEYIKALTDTNATPKPRQMPDLADGHRILDTISKIIDRREKNLLARSVTEGNFNRVMESMAEVVERANAEPDSALRLAAIYRGWDDIRVA